MAERPRVGVIGAGGMGGRHARNLAKVVKGADLVALMDVDRERVDSLARECCDVRIFDDADALINDPDVDALVIASPDPTHADLALACLRAGKPALCEKPLATDAEAAAAVVQAEAKLAMRRLQLGFMRVYDPAHLAVKRGLESEALGRPLMFRSIHDNFVPGRRRTLVDVATNSAVHDFHSACWLMQDEIRTVNARHVPASPDTPDSCRLLLVQLLFEKGALGTIEVNADSGYGYEVVVEITGEEGRVCTADHANAVHWRSGARSTDVPPDWLIRFEQAYVDELRAWVQSLQEGSTLGPSAWDGYRSIAIADAVIRSAESGQPTSVETMAKPSLYAS